jgi:hypothetical protein
VQWNIVSAAGATPSGATTPWLSTKGAFVTDDADVSVSESADGVIATPNDRVEDVSHDKMPSSPAPSTRSACSCTGNFSLQRADLVLELLTDRWTTGAATSLPLDAAGTISLWHDGDEEDVGLDTGTTSANLAAATALLATHLDAPAPSFFVKHGLLSTTDADIRTFTVPLADTARARAQATKIYVYAMVAGACTIKGILKNAAAATVAEVDVVCSGAGFFSSSAVVAGALPASLSSGTAGAPANTALDYTFEFQNTSGANNGTKVYALIWASRG